MTEDEFIEFISEGEASVDSESSPHTAVVAEGYQLLASTQLCTDNWKRGIEEKIRQQSDSLQNKKNKEIKLFNCI